MKSVGGKKMTKAFVRVWLVAGIGHLVFMYSLFLYGFDLSPIDTGLPSPVSKQISFQVARILLMPLGTLWNGWMSKNMPNFMELVLVVLNSTLWGAVIAFSFFKYTKKKTSSNAD